MPTATRARSRTRSGTSSSSQSDVAEAVTAPSEHVVVKKTRKNAKAVSAAAGAVSAPTTPRVAPSTPRALPTKQIAAHALSSLLASVQPFAPASPPPSSAGGSAGQVVPASSPAASPTTTTSTPSPADSSSTTPSPTEYCYDSTRLHNYSELPLWMQDNDAVHTGYRVHYAYSTCLKSVFRLHNEISNIWTHLMGAVVAIALIWYFVHGGVPVGFSTLAERFAHLPARPHTASEFAHAFNNASGNYTTTLSAAATTNASNASNAPLSDAEFASRGIAYRELSALTNEHLPSLDSAAAEMRAHTLDAAANRSVTSFQQRLANLKSALADWCSACPYPFEKIEAARAQMSAAYESLHESLVDTTAYQSLASALERARVSAKNTRFALRQIKLVSHGLGLGSTSPEAAPGDKLPTWPITVFLFTAACAFVCSTSMHTFMARDHCTCNFFNRIDYAGISGLIVGSAIPTIFYALYCSTEWVMFYLITFFVLNVTTTLITLSDAMMKPQYRHFRAAAFALGGGFGIMPVLHIAMLDEKPPVVGQLWTELVVYGLGALIYSKRWPEKKFPGKFDYFTSHTIMHVCVLIACLVHYNLTIDMFMWRETQICPA